MILNEIRSAVKEKMPLIHCITNPISINQCANVILAVGAHPIMAEHPEEVAEITQTAQALVLNLGNITESRRKSIMISAEVAMKNKIPFVLDAVGVACSRLRRELAYEICIKHPQIIKGNYSEIKALHNLAYNSAGVDSDAKLKVEDMDKIAIELAQKYDTIILASGACDIVTDGKTLIHIKNGVQYLSKITGTGCMLGALCGCYIAVRQDIMAAVCACATIGIAGECATGNKGSASFANSLLDKVSTLSDSDLEKYLKLEETEVEKV